MRDLERLKSAARRTSSARTCRNFLPRSPCCSWKIGLSRPCGPASTSRRSTSTLELIEANSENNAYHYNLALAYLRADRIDEARQSADRALELSPHDGNTRKLGDRIDDYLLNAEAAKAREHLEEIRQLRKNGKAEEALVRAEAGMGEFSEEIQPAFVLEIARTQITLEQFEQAIESYRKAVLLHPEQPAVERELAEVYVQVERYQEAAATFRRVYERSGEDPDESLFKQAAESVRKGNKQLVDSDLRKYRRGQSRLRGSLLSAGHAALF